MIELVVDGLPPAKSEATSIFGPTHPHRERVVALLSRTEEVLARSDWQMAESRPIGLELILSLPSEGGTGSDATNYLGGVADTLQAQRINAATEHLGHLADVALYADDRQIVEVHFRRAEGARATYTVRVWVV